MNKKITVIELLNKIANRELKQLTKFKYKNKIFTYARYDKDNPDSDTVTDENHTKLFTGNYSFNFNDEVEILEDNTEEIEEIKIQKEEGLTIEYPNNLVLMDKINELVKAVNSIRKDKNNENKTNK